MAGRHDCRPAVFDSMRLLPIRNRNCDQRQQLEQRQRPYARRLPPGSSQMPHAAGRMIASAATLTTVPAASTAAVPPQKPLRVVSILSRTTSRRALKKEGKRGKSGIFQKK